MKNIVKKSVGVILILLTLLSTLTGCLDIGYASGDYSIGFEFAKMLNAKVRSEKSAFSNDDVTLDLYIGVYDKNETYHLVDDLPETYVLTIYVSNFNVMPFTFHEDVYIRDFTDVDNAVFIREISYKEAFSEEYGYTVSMGKIQYNHSERITIPKELFSPEYDAVYIHIVELYCYKDEDLVEENDKKVRLMSSTSITIYYYLIGDKVFLK